MDSEGVIFSITPEKPERVDFIRLLTLILEDVAKQLCLGRTAFKKDVSYLERRFSSEGSVFLTKTLPKLAKSLDRALAEDSKFLLPPEFSGKVYGKTILPKFLWTLWVLIFDEDGKVKRYDTDYDKGDSGSCHYPPESCRQIIAVRSIRQVGYLLYKMEGSYTPEDEKAVFDKFINVDAELASLPEEFPTFGQDMVRAIENARILLWGCLRDFDPWDIIPRHGPGAVATGEKQWEKFYFKRCFRKLDRVYSFAEYFYLNLNHLCDEVSLYHPAMDDYVEEARAKACAVPKDSRGPRLISEEPLEIQWIQQGLKGAIVKAITSKRSPACGYVNFDNQEINRNLALMHSRGDSDFVTLDLSDASDRVSLWLVEKLFPKRIFEALYASRSESTMLPDGRTIKLNKFAPMGSAVCFPVEALVFWSISVGVLVNIRHCGDLYKLPPVYVYGDDIIMRKQDYDLVRPTFEKLKLRFSEGKCCTGRFFRESCGCDAFKGKDVTPVRISKPWQIPRRQRRLSSKALLAYVAYANALRSDARGFEKASAYLESLLVEQFGPLPITNAVGKCPLAFVRKIGENSTVRAMNLALFKSRYNRSLQRVQIRVPTVAQGHLDVERKPDWPTLFEGVMSIRGDDTLHAIHAKPGRTYTDPRKQFTRIGWVNIDDFTISES
jgi:hypothetical protein